MDYIAFARKYRPRTFDEIAGQPHVTTTLKNAIAQDRVAHAYIFAGPRGVGKTTTARILAKAINCEKAPAADPCGTCPSCKEIADGMSLDVLEIDGASNRGIEEVRNLRENVKFAPSRGRFKVYIIDEVHMLTAEAFNALLKTLEEPPRHVKFIFATTRVYKLPATILSRCQRFDFRKISSADILTNLKKIVRDEKLKVSDEALAFIARRADGSLRDGQVILDQMVSFSRGAVGMEDVARVLGIIEDEILFGLSGAIRSRNASTALKITDRFIREGKDVGTVAHALIEHFRNISVLKIGKDLESLVEAGDEKIAAYRAEAGAFTIEEILYIVYMLSNAIELMRRSNSARIPFETALIKLAQTGSIVSLAEIARRLEGLEKSGGQQPQQPSNETQDAKKSDPKPNSAGPKPAEDLEEITSAWATVINKIKEKKISLASYLEEGDPVSFGNNKLTLAFPKELKLHTEVLDEPANRRMVEVAVKEVLGVSAKLVFTLVEAPARPALQREGYDLPADATKEEDPIVKSSLKMFDGQVISETGARKRAK